jgi:hypothetical protein
MQSYMEGWLVVWLIISLFGLTAILMEEGLPTDWTGRILLTPMVAGIGAYVALPFASAGGLLLAALR